jgi:hypothetical protein
MVSTLVSGKNPLQSEDAESVQRQVHGQLRHDALQQLTTTGKLPDSITEELPVEDRPLQNLFKLLLDIQSSGHKLVATEFPLCSPLSDASRPHLQVAGSVDLIVSDDDTKRVRLIDYKSGKFPSRPELEQLKSWVSRIRKSSDWHSELKSCPFPKSSSQNSFSSQVLQMNIYSFMWRHHYLQHDSVLKLFAEYSTNMTLLYGSGQTSKGRILDLNSVGLVIPDAVILHFMQSVCNSFTAVSSFCDTFGVSQQLKNIAWSFPEQVKEFEDCPETLCMDTAHNTNSGGYYFIEIVGYTRYASNSVPVQGLLRRQDQASFNWFLGEAVPALVSKAALQCTTVFLTDEDDQEIKGFEYAKSKMVFHPDCLRRSCIFHKLIQGFDRIATAFNSGWSAQEQKAMKNMMIDVYRTAESKADADELFKRLKEKYLNSNDNSESSKTPGQKSKSKTAKSPAQPNDRKLVNGVVQTFFEMLHMSSQSWALWNVLYTRCLDRRTTSAAESEHAALKRYATAQTSFSDLLSICHLVLRCRSRDRIASSARVASTVRVSFNVSGETAHQSMVSADRKLTVAGCEFVENQMWLAEGDDERGAYECTCIRNPKPSNSSDMKDQYESVFWNVIWKPKFDISNKPSSSKRKKTSTTSSLGSKSSEVARENEAMVRVDTIKTRVVTLERDENAKLALQCSCGLFNRRLYPCRHMLVVKRFHLKAHADVHPRWFKPHIFKRVWDGDRHRTDGISGPSPFGIPSDELDAAIAAIPSSIARNSRVSHDMPDRDDNYADEVEEHARQDVQDSINNSTSSTFVEVDQTAQPYVRQILSKICMLPKSTQPSLVLKFIKHLQNFEELIPKSHRKTSQLRTKDYAVIRVRNKKSFTKTASRVRK